VYQSQRRDGDIRRVDGMSRDEACAHFQVKIQLLARRLASRIPEHSVVTAGDLASHGALGLMEAFERYEAGRWVSFSSFAEFRIRGAMMDALRAQDTFTRHRRRETQRLEHAVAELRRETGEEPTPEAVAERLGCDLEDYWKLNHGAMRETFTSLNQPAHGDEGGAPLEELLPDPGRDPLTALLDGEARHRLREAIANLPERKRHCIILYYVKNMTLAEIAAVFGLTHSRISQILTETRADLARAIQDEGMSQRTRLKSAI
jgi:RNA polymerase sigma factor FliA